MKTSTAPLPTVDLIALDGTPTTLQEHISGRPVAVLAMRYYGCLPCQHYLVEMHEARERFRGAGVDLLTVGVATDWQAEHLIETYGLEHTLLLDPEQNLYEALALPRIRPIDWLFPRTWIRYLPVFFRRYITRSLSGPGQGRVLVGGSTQLPGIALVRADGTLAWIHRGEGLGDYPPLETVVARAEELVAA